MISLHMPNYVQNIIIDFKSCNTIVYCRLYRGKNKLKNRLNHLRKLEDELFEKILQKVNGLCKYLYSRFIKKIHSRVPTSQLSWPDVFINDNFDLYENIWKYIYENVYFSTVDNKLRNFQLKLIHRCLPRRRILFISNMCDSPMCNFCKTEPDSFVHIYALCPMIQTFWVQIIELINMLFPNITSLTTIDIIFGSFMSNNQPLSYSIIAAKYYIHCCYWSERSPNIDLLKDKLIKY